MQLRGKKGSALIMVMLVIAGITTIVFATQRIALVQFSQSVRDEDNLVAYYAAKAGIEDGLVRYRFEKNAEIYKNIDGELIKFRYNLTKATYPGSFDNYEIDKATSIEKGVGGEKFNPNYQYYDLVMNYKTQRINIDDSGDEDFSLMPDTVIKKDEVLILTGFPPTIDPLTTNYLRHVFNFIDNPTECTVDEEPFVTMQIIRTTEAAGSIQRSSEQIIVKKPAGSNLYDSSVSSANLDVSSSGNTTVSSIRIRAYHCDVQFAFAATKTVSEKLNADAFEFDGLFTEILSTGYFGSTKRTLIAQVNRKTGNLMGIFDFLLYSGGNTGTISQP